MGSSVSQAASILAFIPWEQPTKTSAIPVQHTKPPNLLIE